jgi:hypothetical protein
MKPCPLFPAQTVAGRYRRKVSIAVGVVIQSAGKRRAISLTGSYALTEIASG